MGRQRDPKRDEAFEIYQAVKGNISLVDIAAKLGISAGTVRGWKAKDNWDTSTLKVEKDELFDKAVQIVKESKQASVSLLQRRMRVGYTRAAKLIDAMEKQGLIGDAIDNEPREVFIKKIDALVQSNQSVSKPSEDKDTKHDFDMVFHVAVRMVKQQELVSMADLQKYMSTNKVRAFNMLSRMERIGLIGEANTSGYHEVFADQITVFENEQSPKKRVKRDSSETNMERSINMERSNQIKNVPKKQESLPEEDVEVADKDGLTTKQRVFILEYLRDFNATRAAMAAGYSKRTAYAIGFENLRKPDIQREIERFKTDMIDGLGLSVQRIVMEYMKIAFADMTDYVAFGTREMPVRDEYGIVEDADGNPVMEMMGFVDLHESDEVDGTIISEVKMGRDGVSIKLHSKISALKALEKYTDFLTEMQKAQLEKARVEISKLRGEELDDDTEDDGFMEALGVIAAEVWPNED